VIEVGLDEANNIGPTPLVLRMTGSTGHIGDFTRFAVKTPIALNVIRNIFVTVAAQTILACAIERDVAGRALGLKIGMPAYEFAGHDQRLNSLSISGGTCKTAKHCYQPRKSKNPKNHLVHMHSQYM
jgi:hypothetical protein